MRGAARSGLPLAPPPRSRPSAPDMVSITVEGRRVSVAEGTTILEAAKTAGVLIPHYCYHPGLPIAGVCRMCLVEVEKAAKLAPACATPVAEGQVIHVHSEPAREARKGVLEMLLINHPLDCPICDQSGECELQDYTYAEGRADSRYREAKRFNPVEDFGGDVVYVPNRCILCTRCVRFMDDVAHESTLAVAERGDRAVIAKFEGQDLTHPWAGNVVELCPVGALLSKDFLNKARSWDLDRSASICPNCTQGCNSVLETRDNVVVRMRPRPNEEVNRFFLCDEGRLDYRWLNRRDRAEYPLVRRGDVLVPTEWDLAINEAGKALRGRRTVVLASPMLSNEVLYLLSRLMGRSGGEGTFVVRRGPEAPLSGVPDLALRSERAANVRGAELLGFTESPTPLDRVSADDALVIADEELANADCAVVSQAAARAKTVIVLGTTLPTWADCAAIVLPIGNMAEEEGTFTNLRGRVQRYMQAKSAPGFARPGWAVATDLLNALGDPVAALTPADVFAMLAVAHSAFSGMTYDALGLRGAMVASGSAAEVNA
jgi:NADH-quinone oxidoreductase subunit G